MSNEKIRELLNELHSEIDKTELDIETLSKIQAFDQDIHQLIDPEHQMSDTDSVVESAKLLETNFAVNHPLAERVVREIVETLARMGI